MTEDQGESDDQLRGRRAAAQAQDKLKDIRALFATMSQELTGERFARYQRNVSPGLQEYIEALSFAHYLEHKTLISYEEVQNSLCDDAGKPAGYIAPPLYVLLILPPLSTFLYLLRTTCLVSPISPASSCGSLSLQ